MPGTFILPTPWANLHSPEGFLLLCPLPTTGTPDLQFQERPTQRAQYTISTQTTPATFISAVTNFSCKSLVRVSALLRLPGNKTTVLWVSSEQEDHAQRLLLGCTGHSYAFPKAVYAGPVQTPALVLQRYPELWHRWHLSYNFHTFLMMTNSKKNQNRY